GGVYEWLGQGTELNLRYRSGSHETRAEDIETYLDWLDTVFGRGQFPFPDVAIYPTYEQWQRWSGEKIDVKSFPSNGVAGLLLPANLTPITTVERWLQQRAAIRERIRWGLGEAPPFAETAPGRYGAEAAHLAALLGRATVPAGLQRQSVNFGNYVAGDLYFPTNAD